MAKPELAEVLKTLKSILSSSSTAKICDALNQLTELILDTDSGFNEQLLKGVFKCLLLLLGRYTSSRSRNAATAFVKLVAEQYTETAAKHFVEASKDLCEKHPMPYYGADVLDWLNWSEVILPLAVEDELLLKTLIKYQSNVTYAARLCSKKSATASLKRLWKRILSKHPELFLKYVSTLCDDADGYYHLPLLSSLMESASDQLAQDVANNSAKLVEMLIKTWYSQKSIPSESYMASCSSIISNCSHEVFTSVVLPTMKRFMLRNPEHALFVTAPVIEHLAIDLSKYAMELSKLLSGEVKNKQETRRKIAVGTYRHLASHCSNPESIQELLKHLFSLLKGSEGKVTVLGERMDVVSAIGNLTNNSVSGSLAIQGLATEAMTQFTTLLNQETSEAMITHLIVELCKWVKTSPSSVPKVLVDRMRIGAGPKSTSSTVRQAYLDLMTKCFNSVDSLEMLQPFESQLVATLTTAQGQPAQIPLACEAVYATVLLLRLSRPQLLEEASLQILWKVVLATDKPLLCNDRLLSSASDSVLRAIVSLSEMLVLEHPDKISVSLTELYLRCLLYASCHHSYSVRRSAKQTVKKVVAGLGGLTLSLVMLRLLLQLLDEQNWTEILDDNKEDKVVMLTAKGFVETLHCVTGLTSQDKRELSQIAIAAILPSHHQAIEVYEKDSWLKLLRRLKISPSKLIEESMGEVLPLLTSRSQTDVTSATLKTVVRINGCQTVPLLLQQCKALLEEDPAMTQVTAEEYNIFSWPEGELYDTSVIEKNKESDDMRNMKRENKLYSYQDQLMELELRKELEAKRRAQGKVTEKLSKKQLEAKQAQLKIESDIRSKVSKLDKCVKQVAYIMYNIADAESPAVAHLLPNICEIVVPLLKHPVPAAHLLSVFIRTIQTALNDKALGALVGYLTLRVYEVACELPSNWCSEPLLEQRSRVLRDLAVASPMNAAMFACCYPLFRQILQSTDIDDGQRLAILRIFKSHAELRSDLETDGPSILPRCDMLKVLLHLADTCSKQVVANARTVLISVCACASGEDGCTLAEDDEIEVLQDALLSSSCFIRLLALQGMDEMIDALPTPDADLAADLAAGHKLMKRLWIARFDVDEPVRKLAVQIWNKLELELDGAICEDVLSDITSDVESIRNSVADALRELLQKYKKSIPNVLEISMALYEEKLYRAPPVLDNFGRIVEQQGIDQWKAREGIASLFKKLAPIFTKENVETLINFYVPEALHDREQRVALAMRSAAVELIEHHGKANVQSLLPVLEKTLTTLPDTASYDVVKQGVIVMMGNLAKHLDKDDARVKPIVAKLISSLSTPSQQVQEAVASCLPPLVPSIKDEVPEIVAQLLQLLLNSDNFGERRGAAYGLAGLVKGSGILSLKQLDIMNTLTAAVQNKKLAQEREGALFAFEMLSLMLGRLFEPYIVHVLPHLLLCFGDGNQHVRTAANDTAKAVMSKLSAHGVKLVLPLLLKALQEDQWRTKCGSVELLGAMAFCAPKQLSACLPQIVPELVDVLADSHDKVRNAGATALQHIGEVIKNPEIQSIVPVMLNALKNPSQHTTSCLQALLNTQFVHFIDAPSLALIMPVVTRAIEDRSTETRKMACQIIGNMYSLTDQKDLSPYLPNIMPGLKKSLVDPVPEVRSMSARALGAMVRGIGEQGFDDLLPWLMKTLTSDGNTVNRSGAAQGLSEVIGALGVVKLAQYVDEIITTAARPDIPPYVRDGYIMMFIYLPSVFEKDFSAYIGPILPTILKALADECEYVRDTALRAGQKIINMFADTSIELVLPELEYGLFDENWRIRLSSVQLLGDLLYKLSGVSGKMSTETAHDDDNFGTEISQQMVINSLGPERRNRVLSGLYMGRSDTALHVRQASLHVWKVIVSNTPKTLRDILPTLFSLLLASLASTSYDKREVAARTLGDVVKKLGERVLPEILPILRAGLSDADADKRQGVCIGLNEIMKSTSRDHVIGYSDSLIPTVCKALSDTNGSVREAAAKTFDSLHSNVGTRVLEEILPDLLEKLNDELMQEYALDGMQQVMAIKSHAVLPYLVPKLIHPPVNTKALSLLASVAGQALDRELYKILQAMSGSLANKIGTPDMEEELRYCAAVVLSAQSDAGIKTVIEESLRLFSNKDPRIQAASALVLNVFCKDTKVEYDDYLSQLFRATIGLFASDQLDVLTAGWECVNSIVTRLDANKRMMQVPTVKQALRYAVGDLKGSDLLPGLCLPKKGITCILPVFREGLLNGAPEMKETAAIGLSDAIKVASPDALKPSVVHVTGPLIRVLGDRYGPTVRVAMVNTIIILLIKCGPMLKPFLPQLQTTFVKALNDPSRSVRLKAAEAIAQLIVIHMRVDPVFTEINNGIKNYADDVAVRETFLYALRMCVKEGGAKMGTAIRQEITKTLTALLSVSEDAIRTGSAAALGALIGCLPKEEKTDVILSQILDKNDPSWMVLHARSVALFVALSECRDALLEEDVHRENVISTLLAFCGSDKVPICQFGLRGVAMLIKGDLESAVTLDKRLIIAVKSGMKSDSNDVKQLVGYAIELVSRVANHACGGLDESDMKVWIPVLITGAKEKNSAVKAASEYALITLLQLRQSEATYLKFLPIIDGPKGDALADTYNKGLKKLLKQAEPKDEEFDVTFLK
ncbi:stalled ribosome sensor GCN1-like [Watersipora subatra]|uniref:stalled ribosome sensor GCN1-like n=1 Tax=Watersipora subatra TaxID=2589382 RepID=UPI00355B4476